MESKKHILFISSWYPNRADPTHGIFNRFFAEAAALYNKVCVLHVASDENLSCETDVVETNENNIYTITVYYKKVSSRVPVFSQIQKRTRLLNAFDKGYERLVSISGKPDLIQLNVILPNGFGAYHLAGKHNIPYIINENWTGYMEEDGNYKGMLTKYFTKKIASKASVLMPVSESLKADMLRHNLNGNYCIVPNVVNTERFLPAKNPSSELTRLIHISTMDQVQKNVIGIIKAFEKALKVNSALQLTIVGQGDEEKKLKHMVHQKKLDHCVVFKGALFGQKMVDEINAHDALIMFSNFETFCLVIAEAMACGKPVITSNCGGITSLIKDDLGIQVKPRNEVQLTEAVLYFSKNKTKYEPEIIRKFVTDNFTHTIVAKQLNDIYKKVLS